MRHFVLGTFDGELNRPREDINGKLFMALVVDDDIPVGLVELVRFVHDVEVFVVQDDLVAASLLCREDLAVAALGVVELVLAVSHEVDSLYLIFQLYALAFHVGRNVQLLLDVRCCSVLNDHYSRIH